MKLIIGLGNPGKEYERTRHNVGFLFSDFLRAKWEFSEFTEEKRFSCRVSSGTRGIEKHFLVKPETFMNRSGDTVSGIMSFYKLSPEDILVVHDDLDIPFGSWKASKGSGSAGHNGISDIIGKIGTKDFRRIRIGIGRPEGDRDPADYVLDRFTSEEEARLPEIFEDIFSSL